MPVDTINSRFAIVTGSSSGIGLAVTSALLNQGVKVLAMSRKKGELAPLLSHYAEQLIWCKGDVTQASDLDKLAALAKDIGPVDYLVPNAGIAQLGDSLDAEAFHRQWAVNGAGALNTLAVLRNQLAPQASVVFIATFLSAITFPGLGAYIASKSALKAQARTLAVELAEAGIRINLVSPGPTATPIWGSLGLDETSLNSVATSVCQRLLTGQFLEASAVADAIVFLLSDAARGIYGQDLVVDAGFTLS
jgi:NAD(P)-dependent dehydrogenase (short-subunit alcohol dehydrogenase family)